MDIYRCTFICALLLKFETLHGLLECTFIWALMPNWLFCLFLFRTKANHISITHITETQQLFVMRRKNGRKTTIHYHSSPAWVPCDDCWNQERMEHVWGLRFLGPPKITNCTNQLSNRLIVLYLMEIFLVLINNYYVLSCYMLVQNR